MPTRPREGYHERCAYCGAPLPLNIGGVEAWRVGDGFVCNEFCADGIPRPRTRHSLVLHKLRDVIFPRSSAVEFRNCRCHAVTVNQTALALLRSHERYNYNGYLRRGRSLPAEHEPRGEKTDE
jgi:hypothetical protein